jgi:hypothetical protein
VPIRRRKNTYGLEGIELSVLNELVVVDDGLSGLEAVQHRHFEEFFFTRSEPVTWLASDSAKVGM